MAAMEISDTFDHHVDEEDHEIDVCDTTPDDDDEEIVEMQEALDLKIRPKTEEIDNDNNAEEDTSEISHTVQRKDGFVTGQNLDVELNCETCNESDDDSSKMSKSFSEDVECNSVQSRHESFEDNSEETFHESMDCQSSSDSESTKDLENKNPQKSKNSDLKHLENNNNKAQNQDIRQPNNNIPKLTNFFIENILKPEFGRRKSEAKIKSAFTKTKPKIRQEPSEKVRDLPESVKEDVGKLSPVSVWPAWVYCTRYSDRPSSGPRTRKIKKSKEKKADEKRPRTAFTNDQLQRLKKEFDENRYLTEQRRQDLARELKLNESQIKIWFQNKRAKMKKANGLRNPLAVHLMAQGLYNHSTVPVEGEEGYDVEASERPDSNA